MATASFEPGTEPPVTPPLDRVAADMRAIFGMAGGAVRPSPDRFRAKVRTAAAISAAGRRGRWRRVAGVLIAGGGAGALLGWWVLAAPQEAPHRAPGPAYVQRAAPADATVPRAPVTPVLPAPLLAPLPSETPVPAARPPLRQIAPAAADVRPADPIAPLPSAMVAAVPAPPRPSYVPAPDAPAAPPPIAEQRYDDGCARSAQACTAADARDAELQFREAYAAAVDARVAPRALAAVRQRWGRFLEADAGRPDLLVTDYARLSGRLAWLAGEAGPGDGRE